MKASINIIAAIAIFASGCHSDRIPLQSNFEIQTDFPNTIPAELRLLLPDSIIRMDTIDLWKGKAGYVLPYVNQYYSIKFNELEYVFYLAEKNYITATITNQFTDSSYIITGSPASSLLKQWTIVSKTNMAPKQRQNKIREFINENKNSPASIFAFHNAIKNNIFNFESDHEFIEGLIQAWNGKFADNPYYLYIKDNFDAFNTLVFNDTPETAPDFRVPDAFGTTQTLDSCLQSSYLLFGFWISSSEKSRSDNAELREILQNYRYRGLSIAQYSLDTITRNWGNAMVEDRIYWKQICDREGWQSPVVANYGVNILPNYVLINSNKDIIYRHHQLDSIQTYLENVFN